MHNYKILAVHIEMDPPSMNLHVAVETAADKFRVFTGRATTVSQYNIDSVIVRGHILPEDNARYLFPKQVGSGLKYDSSPLPQKASYSPTNLVDLNDRAEQLIGKLVDLEVAAELRETLASIRDLTVKRITERTPVG